MRYRLNKSSMVAMEEQMEYVNGQLTHDCTEKDRHNELSNQFVIVICCHRIPNDRSV